MSIIGNPLLIGGSGGGGGGGSAVEEKDVNFIDYDGTILYSYTKAEFANLSALPANPSHTGLTAQGWNWTKAQITAQLTAMPDAPVWVGQMYVTSSGDTEIDIELFDGRLSPYLGIAVNGTVTVSWGDGNTSTVTGTGLTTQKRTKHDYAAAGDYTITIHADSGSYAFFGTNAYYLLSKNTSTANINKVYSNTIQAVRIGNSASIGNYAFYMCTSIRSITIPSAVTSIGTYAFANCYSLYSITIPNTITDLSANAFNTCYSFEKISIPSGVTTTGGGLFNNCKSLHSVTMPSGLTSLGYSAFFHCNALANAQIPSGITSIDADTYDECYCLNNITIPSAVTSIANYAFYQCFGLGEIHFKASTPPTVGGSSAWTSIPTDCKIYVPSAKLSAYKSAANYPSSSTYTYIGE